MPSLPISCFIIAKNEADRIARTIRSVKSWVDEVIVVDSDSSDDTVAIARSEGCRVISQPWLGFGGQKRFAEDQCRNNWILNLDADEVVTPDLKQEVIASFAGRDPALAAYAIPVLMVYPGDEKPRLWARDHVYVRLYDRRVVRFRNSEVHDTVVTDGHEVGRLHAAVYHYSMRSFADMSRKLDERTWLSVRVAEPCSAAKLLLRLPIEFPMNLLKYYIVRRHWTGGIKGLRFASIQARYRLLKVWRLWLRTMFGTPVPAVGPHEPISIDDDDRGGGGAQNLMRDGGAADGRQSRSTQFSPAPDNRIAAGEVARVLPQIKERWTMKRLISSMRSLGPSWPSSTISAFFGVS